VVYAVGQVLAGRWCSVPPRATFELLMPRQIARTGTPEARRRGSAAGDGVPLGISGVPSAWGGATVEGRLHVAAAAGEDVPSRRGEQRRDVGRVAIGGSSTGPPDELVGWQI